MNVVIGVDFVTERITFVHRLSVIGNRLSALCIEVHLKAMKSKLYILTGASRGMGLAMAEQLARAGHSLICISRQSNAELANLARHRNATLEQWQLDLANSVVVAARLRSWLGAANASHFQSISLINNAGVIAKIGPFSETDSNDLENAMRVGLEAPMQLTAAFLHATADWKIPRKVLNISSGLGRRAMASQAAYCAAKAGMDHFTRCVALDEALKDNGAKVCSLAPGVIATDMQVQLRGADPAQFPDIANFIAMHDKGMLDSPQTAAGKVLAYLEWEEFGSNAVADIRD